MGWALRWGHLQKVFKALMEGGDPSAVATDQLELLQVQEQSHQHQCE